MDILWFFHTGIIDIGKLLLHEKCDHHHVLRKGALQFSILGGSFM